MVVMAKANGLDFFAVTPHNHLMAEGGAVHTFPNRKDGVLIAKQPELYNSTTPVNFTRKWKNGQTESHSNQKSVISAAKDETDSNFLAIYGQEFSTGSGGNHINVFGITDVINVENGRFDLLLQEVSDLACAQSHFQMEITLNHQNQYQYH